jgi:hypothetical protein
VGCDVVQIDRIISIFQRYILRIFPRINSKVRKHEGVCSSEFSVTFYWTTRRHTPALDTRRQRSSDGNPYLSQFGSSLMYEYKRIKHSKS